MTTEAYKIAMATFPDEEGAGKALDTLEGMAKDGTIDVIDAAVLIRDAAGEVKVTQKSLPRVKSGATTGAIIGGVIGVIFPPSIIGAALVGAGIGAGAAKLGKMALKSPDLDAAANELEPGTSALVAVVEEVWIEQLSKAAAGYSKLAEHGLDADAVAQLGIVADDETGVVETSATAHATDPETGASMAAQIDEIADTTSGVVVQSGAVAAVDPDSGEIGIAGFEGVAVAGEVTDDDGSAPEDESTEA